MCAQRCKMRTALSRRRPRSLPYGGKAKSVIYAPERYRRRVIPFARFARKGLPLYERKPSRRIRDRSEARERYADRATLCQLSAESCESSKKTMQSGPKVREHCCLASFRRRTGCSPPLWRSRRHERQNSMEFCRAMSQPARISGALRFYFSVPSGSLVMGST